MIGQVLPHVHITNPQRYNAINVRPIKEVNGDCKLVDAAEADFFGVYLRTEEDEIVWEWIVDFPTYTEAHDCAAKLCQKHGYNLEINSRCFVSK